MTKEEKIELLNCMVKLTDDSAFYDTEEKYYDANEIKEVLREAIKALEQDVPDTNVGKIDSDCVSRADVKELFQEGCV